MHIRHIAVGVASLLLSFGFVLPASANTTVLSFDPSYAQGPFVFYCEPYGEAFVSGGFYQTTDGACAFSQPASITGIKGIAVYKGTVGNSTFVAGSSISSGATLVQEDSVSFGAPQTGDDYFGIVWDTSLLGGSNTAFGNYLATGSQIPAEAVENQNYYILPFKWGLPPDVCPLVNGHQATGPCASDQCVAPAAWNVAAQQCEAPVVNDTTPPTIVITNPLKYGVYARAESVLLTATITDASPIVEKTYWLNGKKIDNMQPLPFNASTSLLSKVMVAAQDAAGNRATSTLPFFVVKSKSSCLTDIIAILLALAQDKTLPDKPTLQNLIDDCSCFNLGHHRWDWNRH
jgi:hypothetical protein